MLCDNCGKREATTHISRVENGRSVQSHLCSSCASQLSVNDIFGDFSLFNLRNIFSSLFGDSGLYLSEKEEQCDVCASSFSDIVKSGFVGCPACYEKFGEKLAPSIRRMHGKGVHTGKRPKNLIKIQPPTRQEILAGLEKQLGDAINTQNFEQAAVLRDKINDLKEAESNE